MNRQEGPGPWSEDAVNACSGALAVMCMQQTATSVAQYVVATDALPTRDSASLNHHYAMILAREYLRLIAEVKGKGDPDVHSPVDRQGRA